MKPEKISEEFVKNLLRVMPEWHARLVRPFKESLNGEMSLETYYCLETVKAQGMVTMSGLAGQLKIPKQQVTKLVDNLSVHGFVERSQKEDDRRVIWIRLSPKAVAYLDEYYRKNMAFIRLLESRLSEEETARLNQAVETLGELLPRLK